jgi:hypothetical protein
MWKAGVQERQMGIAGSENGNYSRKEESKPNVCPFAIFSYSFRTTSHLHNMLHFTPETGSSMSLQTVGTYLHSLII